MRARILNAHCISEILWQGNASFLGFALGGQFPTGFPRPEKARIYVQEVAFPGHVDLVEIPSERLQQIRDVNRERCGGDALMPRFSADIVYVCVSKTHFVHGQKLAKDGNRFLFNENKMAISWQDDDVEGLMILEQGPVCVIYSSTLFDDVAAMNSLASTDNLNASVQWGEDEMQAFGRVHLMVDNLAPSQAHETMDQQELASKILASIQVSGLGKFSEDNWKQFIALRWALPASIAKVLQTCQFHACAGRVSVRPSDFGLAAKLDPRAPWAKVALILWQYLGSMDQKQIFSNSATFTGRSEITAKKLQQGVVKELVAGPRFVLEVESFVKSILQQYSKPTGGGKQFEVSRELLTVRGQLLANCGKFLLKVGQALEQANHKASARRLLLSPAQRSAIVETETAGKYSIAEGYIRKQLVKKNLFSEATLPPAVYAAQNSNGNPALAPSQASSHKAKEEARSSNSPTLAQQCELTDAHVYSRLGVKGCGGEVLAFIDPEKVRRVFSDGLPVKSEETDDTSGVLDVVERELPSDTPAWMKVRLISVTSLDAVVEVFREKGNQLFKVSVDELRPCGEVKVAPVILHPSIQDQGQLLNPYDYDCCGSPLAKVVAEHMLLYAHLSAHASVEHVRVAGQSDEGKLPLILQARALQSFRKGTLVLAPAFGEMLQAGDDTTRAPSQGVIHDAMLSKLPVVVRCGKVDRRRKADGDTSHDTVFEVRSPLLGVKNLKARSTCLQNLTPFWALLRCASPKAEHNMALEDTIFQVSGVDVKDCKFPKMLKTLDVSVQIPIARNSTNIQKGEVLCLPFPEQ